MIREGPRPQFLGNRFPRFGTRVDYGNELTALRLRVFLCVEPSEIADTDDRCSDFCHLAAIMPRPGSGPSCQVRSEECAFCPTSLNVRPTRTLVPHLLAVAAS